MSDLALIDRRIASAGTVKDIIHSMRALSASQFRHASEALDSVRSYSQTLSAALSRLPNDVLVPPAAPSRQVIIVMASDQGLCGPLTVRLVRHAQSHAAALDQDFAGFLAVGRQARDLLLAENEPVVAWRSSPLSLAGTDAMVASVTRRIEKLMTDGLCDGVLVIFAHLLGVGSFEPQAQRVVPIDPGSIDGAHHESEGMGPRTYQSPSGIAAALLEDWGHMALYKAALESLASEHGARLAVTDAATRTVEKNLENLRIERNHLRQEAVTEEIQEVIRSLGAWLL